MMMRHPRFKILWSALAFIVLAFLGHLGSTYAKLRTVEHHMPLVVLSLSPDLDRLSRAFVKYEIRRRVSNDEFDGVFVLADTISAGLQRNILREHTIQQVTWLLDGVVDVNERSKNGHTSLHVAVAGNDVDAARLLVEFGADPMVTAAFGQDSSNELNAIEFLQVATEWSPDRDYTQLLEILEGAARRHE